MKTGEAIREARKRKGLTLKQLEHQLGLSHSAISQFENDKGNPSRRTLIDLARVLDDNFGLDWLDEFRVPPPPAATSLEEHMRGVIREIVKEEVEAALAGAVNAPQPAEQIIARDLGRANETDEAQIPQKRRRTG